jgi:hypothetical protein
VGSLHEASNATGINGDQSDNSAPDAGAVYVFVRSGSTWTQQAYLKAWNTDAGDNFSKCALSGDTLVVAASLEDSNATGVNGDQSDNSALDAGAAYIFTGLGTAPGFTPTPSPTPTGTPPLSAMPTLTPTSAPSACVGDCSGDHSVTVDEILTLVNIALGDANVSTCLAGDANHDNQITIDEILTAVNNALNGCGARAPTPTWPPTPPPTPTPQTGHTANDMLGTWLFTEQGTTMTFTDNYRFDDVQVVTGINVAVGSNLADGTTAIAERLQDLVPGSPLPYEMSAFNQQSIICQLFLFDFTGPNTISGDDFISNVDSTGSCSPVGSLPFTGARTATGSATTLEQPLIQPPSDTRTKTGEASTTGTSDADALEAIMQAIQRQRQ